MAPLQSVLRTALGVLVFVGGPLAAGYWVYRDASVRRAEDALVYGVAAAVLSVFAVPIYLVRRDRLGPRLRWTRFDRTVGVVATALLTGAAAGGFLSPPDPFSTVLLAAAVALLVGLVAYPLAQRWVPVFGAS